MVQLKMDDHCCLKHNMLNVLIKGNKGVASCVWLLDFADCYIKDDNTKLDWEGPQVHFDKFKKLLGLKVVKALCTLNALTSSLYTIIIK